MILFASVVGLVLLAVCLPQLGKHNDVASNNAQRASDVNVIASAIVKYVEDNNTLPHTIVGESCSDSVSEICHTDAPSCAGLVDLSSLTLNKKYLVNAPIDPRGSTTANGTGYRVVKGNDSQVIVCAPAAEGGAGFISVTR